MRRLPVHSTVIGVILTVVALTFAACRPPFDERILGPPLPGLDGGSGRDGGSRSVDVTLAWDRNTGPQTVGYILYWGTEQGVYPYSADVHGRTNHTVTELPSGRDFYFVVTAYDNRGRESRRSNEVVYRGR
jgi:hypothetical protein